MSNIMSILCSLSSGTGIFCEFYPLIRPSEIEFEFTANGKIDFQNACVVFTEKKIENRILPDAVVGVQFTYSKGGLQICESGSLLNIQNDGKVKNLTIDAGNKKRNDIVRIKDDVKLIKAEMEMGKGNDTVRFGKGASFKGKSTVDLGKGGKDAIVIEADAIKGGKLVVTSFSKKDTITVGEETFTYKDIKNGASIPGVKVELA